MDNSIPALVWRARTQNGSAHLGKMKEFNEVGGSGRTNQRKMFMETTVIGKHNGIPWGQSQYDPVYQRMEADPYPGAKSPFLSGRVEDMYPRTYGEVNVMGGTNGTIKNVAGLTGTPLAIALDDVTELVDRFDKEKFRVNPKNPLSAHFAIIQHIKNAGDEVRGPMTDFMRMGLKKENDNQMVLDHKAATGFLQTYAKDVDEKKVFADDYNQKSSHYSGDILGYADKFTSNVLPTEKGESIESKTYKADETKLTPSTENPNIHIPKHANIDVTGLAGDVLDGNPLYIPPPPGVIPPLIDSIQTKFDYSSFDFLTQDLTKFAPSELLNADRSYGTWGHKDLDSFTWSIKNMTDSEFAKLPRSAQLKWYAKYMFVEANQMDSYLRYKDLLSFRDVYITPFKKKAGYLQDESEILEKEERKNGNKKGGSSLLVNAEPQTSTLPLRNQKSKNIPDIIENGWIEPVAIGLNKDDELNPTATSKPFSRPLNVDGEKRSPSTPTAKKGKKGGSNHKRKNEVRGERIEERENGLLLKKQKKEAIAAAEAVSAKETAQELRGRRLSKKSSSGVGTAKALVGLAFGGRTTKDLTHDVVEGWNTATHALSNLYQRTSSKTKSHTFSSRR